MACDVSIIRQYLKADKNLTLLSGKKPILEDWTELSVDENKILNWDGNLGWQIGPGDLVIDVDVKNGGIESYEKLKEDIPLLFDIEPTVKTISGGLHIYLKFDVEEYENVKFRKTLKRDYPGIDFLTTGSQCVIPSSTIGDGSYIWYDCDFGMFEQTNAPYELLDLLAKGSVRNTESTSDDLGDFEGLIPGERSNWSEDKVRSLLERIDPSIGNDEWVKVGMALHEWDPVEGLGLWEDWSKNGDNWEKGQTEVRWRSFDHGGGVTLGSIAYMAKENDLYKQEKQFYDAATMINGAKSMMDLELDIAPQLKKMEFTGHYETRIIKCFQTKTKLLTQVSMPVAEVRNLILGIKGGLVTSGEFVGAEGSAPDWCTDWVYVNSHMGFMELETLQIYKSEAFNIKCGSLVPPNEKGNRNSATKFVSDNGFMDVVTGTVYLPDFDDRIVYFEGNPVVNTFDPSSIPVEAEEYSESGKKAIEVVKRHIGLICGNDMDRDIFIQWLAHQVQYPGRKILWSPIIQSIPGIGKSFFGSLMRSCLGHKNVGVVAPKAVVSDYNGWATDVVVNVLEELRVKGHNRHDAINALKPLITDDVIQVTDKYIKAFNTRNTANYMCFTNYKDAIPVDENDRRWWVIFAPWQSLDEMCAAAGEEKSTYFDKIFDAVYSHSEELRKWLLEYPISKEFMSTKQAPMTSHKQIMIATEEAGTEGLDEIRDIIEKEGLYFKPGCVCSADVFSAFEFSDNYVELSLRQKNEILKRLGYSKHPKKIKLDGKAKVFWTKKSMTNQEIRDEFEL